MKKNIRDNCYDPVPEDSLILGENRYYSKDCFKTQLNNNVLVVGTSGAGKTRSIVRPNLLQASGSYVVSDPKGNLYKSIGPYLKSKGYEIITIDFIHPEHQTDIILSGTVRLLQIYANWHMRWHMKIPWEEKLFRRIRFGTKVR